jgi:hypothetical protein
MNVVEKNGKHYKRVCKSVPVIESEIPKAPDGFIKFWLEKVSLIPEGREEGASVSMDFAGDYCMAEFDYEYLEPLTDTELFHYQKQIKNAKEAKASKARREDEAERAEYERLKAKFEGK